MDLTFRGGSWLGLMLLATPGVATAQSLSVSLVIRIHRFEPEQLTVLADQKVERPGHYEFFGDFNPKTERGHLVAQ